MRLFPYQVCRMCVSIYEDHIEWILLIMRGTRLLPDKVLDLLAKADLSYLCSNPVCINLTYITVELNLTNNDRKKYEAAIRLYSSIGAKRCPHSPRCIVAKYMDIAELTDFIIRLQKHATKVLGE